jgi:hypothetical protein
MYDLSVPTARDPLIAITIFVIIAIVTTIVRIQARKLKHISLGLEDFLLLAALVSHDFMAPRVILIWSSSVCASRLEFNLLVSILFSYVLEH